MADWLEQVAWERRSAELGPLREHIDPSTLRPGVVVPTTLAMSEPTAAMWARLKAYPMLLESAGPDDQQRLLLRYAAIDWTRKPILLETHEDTVRAATWGVEITRALEFIYASVPIRERGLFACPAVFLDLAQRVRLGFFTRDPARLPPDLIDASCTESDLVFVAGRLVGDLVDLNSDDPLATIARRCISRDEAHRYRTLAEARRALFELGARKQPFPPRGAWNAWLECERGIGYFLLDELPTALNHLERALDMDPKVPVAGAALDEIARRQPKLPRGRGVQRYLNWFVIEPEIVRLEAMRDFRGALEWLRRTRDESPHETPVRLAFARCWLETGELGEALEALGHVLADEPHNLEAHRLHALVLLRTNRSAEALAAADAWLVEAPDDGLAHHTRGKVLATLGRPVDARASFDRASQLSPGLVAAAISRTNLDRAAKSMRGLVGSEAYRTLEVPPHLAELEPLLAKGRLLDAILWLTDRYEDPEARRLLASCHEYAGDYEAALHVYGHLADPRGIARCLIALGRPEEALAATADPELRADALDDLGRAAEAAEIRQHIAFDRELRR